MKGPKKGFRTEDHRDYRQPLSQGGTALDHCGLCGCLTSNLGTKRCDRCYGLEIRVKADPKLTLEILGLGEVGEIADSIKELASAIPYEEGNMTEILKITSVIQRAELISNAISKALRMRN